MFLRLSQSQAEMELMDVQLKSRVALLGTEPNESRCRCMHWLGGAHVPH